MEIDIFNIDLEDVQVLFIVPQDANIAALMDRASSAIARAGLSAQGFLDELPAIRGELLRENYDAAFLERLQGGAYTRVAQGTSAPDDATGGSPSIEAQRVTPRRLLPIGVRSCQPGLDCGL